MVVAIFLLVPTLMATWFCYWLMGSLGPLWNRASRIASLFCPLLVALFLIFLAETMDFVVSGSDTLNLSKIQMNSRGGIIAGITLALTFFLTLPTLVIAFIAGSISKNRAKS